MSLYELATASAKNSQYKGRTFPLIAEPRFFVSRSAGDPPGPRRLDRILFKSGARQKDDDAARLFVRGSKGCAP